jgi:hypothetical protein
LFLIVFSESKVVEKRFLTTKYGGLTGNTGLRGYIWPPTLPPKGHIYAKINGELETEIPLPPERTSQNATYLSPPPSPFASPSACSAPFRVPFFLSEAFS